MFKRITLLNKKEDMSRDEFISYYENSHLPLCMSLLPPPLLHRRNYPILNDPLSSAMEMSRGLPNSVDYDCISEVIHKDREAAQRYLAAMMSPDTLAIIKDDERKFLRKGGIKVFIVDTYQVFSDLL